MLKDYVAALVVTEVSESALEGADEVCEPLARAAAEIADPPDFLRLLCLCRKRPESQAQSESDHEPDHRHGHLGRDGWRESSRPELLAAWGRSGRRLSSTATR